MLEVKFDWAATSPTLEIDANKLANGFFFFSRPHQGSLLGFIDCSSGGKRSSRLDDLLALGHSIAVHQRLPLIPGNSFTGGSFRLLRKLQKEGELGPPQDHPVGTRFYITVGLAFMQAAGINRGAGTLQNFRRAASFRLVLEPGYWLRS